VSGQSGSKREDQEEAAQAALVEGLIGALADGMAATGEEGSTGRPLCEAILNQQNLHKSAN
jgi:hypothetical protein